MTDQIVILNTCVSADEAHKIAQLLLDRRLAACINIIPGCQSYYHWQGKIENSSEWLLLIKSSRSLFPEVSAAIEGAHSYDVPEVIALPVVDGSANYLNWLHSNVRSNSEDQE